MTMFFNKIVLSLFLISFLKTSLVANAKPATFAQDFHVTWGDSHIKQLEGGRAIQHILDQNSDQVRDGLDFEFLENRTGEPYTVQTNVYAHGKGDREQRINLWFDPAADYHTYSIMWNHRIIVYYVDDVPIRVYKNNEAKGIPFPKCQPMGVYSTLWEADDWALRGGLEKIDWSRAPF